jgi:hypothetical protein
VLGGGPAGMEVARVAARRGHHVTIYEQSDRLGGMAVVAGPHAALVEWYERELRALDVKVELGRRIDNLGDLGGFDGVDGVIVQCTGGRIGPTAFEVAGGVVVDIAELRKGSVSIPDRGDVVVFDPIGGPIGVALAEELGERAVLITQDNIAGNELARTGDLAPANTRLAQRGVRIERRTLLRVVHSDRVDVEDRYSGLQRSIQCVAVVDCGFRIPTDPIDGVVLHAGDAVAPRTVFEAVLEGRRIALSL